MTKLSPQGVIANQLQVHRQPGSENYPLIDVDSAMLRNIATGILRMLDAYGYAVVPKDATLASDQWPVAAVGHKVSIDVSTPQKVSG